ncbi:MAG: threonine synthase [Bacteroidales bacterium]|jgi:threonine synthase|nr:threonine synthase [Bacteroidales bacterium]
MTTNSLYSDLQCVECGKSHDIHTIHTLCENPDCKAILSAHYNFSANTLTKEELKHRPATLWRYKEFLPILNEEHIVNLGEGFTPIVLIQNLAQYTNGKTVLLKDESFNPTGSFKARGMALAVSKAKELGVKECITPTAGNAGGALAAYSARAGLKAHIYMPKLTPDAFKIEARLLGAEVIEIDGNIADCGKLVNVLAAERAWFDVSTLKEPFRLEGKKTMGYEIAEQLDWELPDVILYPTGGGTGIVGIWKAFGELEKLGWIGSKRPRMVAVQSDSCNGIHTAFQNKAERSEYKDNGFTVANGLRVPKPYADKVILQVLRQSNGNSVSVSDAHILAALHELSSHEGFLPAPEGAALWHAYKELSASGWIQNGERVLLLSTGSAYKYFDNIRAPHEEINEFFI